MGHRADGRELVHVGGDGAALVDRMRAPLLKALSGRGAFYAVRVNALGPGGAVLVSITASKGRIPLLFGPGELKAAHISQVVRAALDGAAL